MSLDSPNHRDDTESDDERMIAAAIAVLQRRLDGEPHRSAVLRVCVSHSLAKVEVDRAWAGRRRDALAVLTMGRVMDACPWTEAEVARLSQIFSGKLWPGSAGGTGTEPGSF